MNARALVTLALLALLADELLRRMVYLRRERWIARAMGELERELELLTQRGPRA